MVRIVQLSDLHLGKYPELQEPLLLALTQALRGFKADLFVFTGDVFDSTSLNPPKVVTRFLRLLEDFDQVVGPGARTLIIPGNHDRRDSGVFAPLNHGLFHLLAERARGLPRVSVLGCCPPFLATYVELPDFPFHVVAYDSTFLPRGWISAGGVLRQQDLLEVADRLRRENDDKPVLFLLHHHLVPTPITDVEEVEVSGRGWVIQQLVRRVLPQLVANADREELTMTVLGAGTALSTLHSFDRAVVVLHGHKHYPTARLLTGVNRGEGDLLLLGAGSCGTSEEWLPRGAGRDESERPKYPRLWPSFNVLELDGAVLGARSITFPPMVDDQVLLKRPRVNPRPLATVRQRGPRWESEPATPHPSDREPVVSLNEKTVELCVSEAFVDRFDARTTRRVTLGHSPWVNAYEETVSAAPKACLKELTIDGVTAPDAPTPHTMPLPSGKVVSYRLQGAVCSSVAEAERLYREDGPPFEWVALFNRHSAALVRLVVKLGPVDVARQRPFASVTNVATGQQAPARLAREGEAWLLEVRDCPARTLLRVYWPLTARP